VTSKMVKIGDIFIHFFESDSPNVSLDRWDFIEVDRFENYFNVLTFKAK
jgi:hypothetical protein